MPTESIEHLIPEITPEFLDSVRIQLELEAEDVREAVAALDMIQRESRLVVRSV